MAGLIELSPEELIAQGTQMSSLQAEYETLFSQVTNSLNSMNEYWSPEIASNFSGKIESAQKSFTSIVNMLINGSTAAKIAGATFSSDAGSILAQIMGESSGTFDMSQLGTLSMLLKDSGMLDGTGSTLTDIMAKTGLSAEQIAKGLQDGSLLETASSLFADNPMMQDLIKATSLASNGDINGICEMVTEKGTDYIASMLCGEFPTEGWVSDLESLTGGKLGLSGLEHAFWKNIAKDDVQTGAEMIVDIVNGNATAGSIAQQVGELAWNSSAGAALKTGGDAAFDVVSKIPGVGDWYKSQGITNAEGALSKGLDDVTFAVTGDAEFAASVGSYYSEKGGVAKGVVSGMGDIIGYMGEKLSPALSTGFHSVFGK